MLAMLSVPQHAPHSSSSHIASPSLLCLLQGFIRPASRAIVIDAADPAELLEKMAAYQAPPSLIKLASDGKLHPTQRG